MINRRIAASVLALLCIGCHAGPLFAQSKKAAAGAQAAAAPEPEKYYWMDGETKRAIWLSSDLVADFSKPGKEGSAASATLQGADPEAKVMAPQAKGVRLWRMGRGRSAKEVYGEIRVADPAAKISPVFLAGPGEGSRRMALPGNVLLQFVPGTTEESARAWISSQGHEFVRRIPVGEGVYVIRSAAGLASLELANRLHGVAPVKSAQPDWWMETEAR